MTVRAPTGQALAVPVEPASGLAPTGFDPSRIPVITLWQPWASLVFSGHKRFETRSFAPPFKYVGSRIAIHAAAAMPARRHITEELSELCYDAFGCGWYFSLPRGAILGTAHLGGFYPTEKVGFIGEDERIAGDWSDGRYCWQLLDVRRLKTPLPAKGKQGWWSIAASAIEAGTGETRSGSTEGESAIPKGGAPNQSEQSKEDGE